MVYDWTLDPWHSLFMAARVHSLGNHPLISRNRSLHVNKEFPTNTTWDNYRFSCWYPLCTDIESQPILHTHFDQHKAQSFLLNHFFIRYLFEDITKQNTLVFSSLTLLTLTLWWQFIYSSLGHPYSVCYILQQSVVAKLYHPRIFIHPQMVERHTT